jgi:hypothetical protein
LHQAEEKREKIHLPTELIVDASKTLDTYFTSFDSNALNIGSSQHSNTADTYTRIGCAF